MKPLQSSLTILMALTLLSGCSAPYYGHTKEQWQSLTESEKTAIKEEYQTAIDAKNHQGHTDKINTRTQSLIEHGVDHSID